MKYKHRLKMYFIIFIGFFYSFSIVIIKVILNSIAKINYISIKIDDFIAGIIGFCFGILMYGIISWILKKIKKLKIIKEV